MRKYRAYRLTFITYCILIAFLIVLSTESVCFSECSYILAGDYNKDCKRDMQDFANFASDWLIDCNNSIDNSSCIYDPNWQTEPPMYTARDQFTGGVINGKIYVFGGNGNPDGFNLKSTEVFNPLAIDPADEWTQLADNNHHDSGRGVEELTGAVVNNKLYVFGAWGGSPGIANFNEMYDPNTNLWTTLAQKPTPVSSAPSVVYNGKIYIFGGYYEYGSMPEPNIYDVVESYDVVGNSWQYVTNMPKLLVSSAVAVVGNEAYLIGGFDIDANEMNTDILTYNFDTGIWQQNILTSMPNDRARTFPYSSSAPVNGDKIYLIGGAKGNAESNIVSKNVDIYDTASDRWRTVKDLPLPIDHHLSLFVGNKIYIIGGCNNSEYYNRAKHGVISGEFN